MKIPAGHCVSLPAFGPFRGRVWKHKGYYYWIVVGTDAFDYDKAIVVAQGMEGDLPIAMDNCSEVVKSVKWLHAYAVYGTTVTPDMLTFNHKKPKKKKGKK